MEHEGGLQIDTFERAHGAPRVPSVAPSLTLLGKPEPAKRALVVRPSLPHLDPDLQVDRTSEHAGDVPGARRFPPP